MHGCQQPGGYNKDSVGQWKTFFMFDPNISFLCGRSSDLLHLPGAFPSRVRDSGRDARKIPEITAAGTVQDFHLIPFSFPPQKRIGKPHGTNVVKYMPGIPAGSCFFSTGVVDKGIRSKQRALSREKSQPFRSDQ